MSQPQAVAIDTGVSGRLAVRGALVFATARRAHAAGLRAIEGASQSLEVDCSEVGESDSAGLAVLLDWLAAARRRGIELRFTRVPESLLDVARISEIEALLA